MAFYLGRIDTVLPAMTAVEAAMEVGDAGLLAEALSSETISRFFVGELVDELVEHAQLVGTAQSRAFARSSQAELWAWVGRLDEVRPAAEEALAHFAQSGVATFPLFTVAALGMAALSAGDHQEASQWLAPAAEVLVSMDIHEPSVFPFLPDAAEALVALGRIDEAEPLVDLLETAGRKPDRDWAQAVGARCRALLV